VSPCRLFPNEIPIEGTRLDVWENAQEYVAWVLQTDLPKLFFWFTLAVIIIEDMAARFIQRLRNTKNANLGPGLHYLQEDHPHKIGGEVAQ
jgi:haloalkane dehalogenase